MNDIFQDTGVSAVAVKFRPFFGPKSTTEVLEVLVQNLVGWLVGLKCGCKRGLDLGITTRKEVKPAFLGTLPFFFFGLSKPNLL